MMAANQEFRQLYATLDDDALLEMRGRSGLRPEALAVLDELIAERELDTTSVIRAATETDDPRATATRLAHASVVYRIMRNSLLAYIPLIALLGILVASKGVLFATIGEIGYNVLSIVVLLAFVVDGVVFLVFLWKTAAALSKWPWLWVALALAFNFAGAGIAWAIMSDALRNQKEAAAKAMKTAPAAST